MTFLTGLSVAAQSLGRKPVGGAIGVVGTVVSSLRGVLPGSREMKVESNLYVHRPSIAIPEHRVVVQQLDPSADPEPGR